MNYYICSSESIHVVHLLDSKFTMRTIFATWGGGGPWGRSWPDHMNESEIARRSFALTPVVQTSVRLPAATSQNRSPPCSLAVRLWGR